MTTLHVHEDHRNLYHKWSELGSTASIYPGQQANEILAEKNFIHITPTPVLARLERLHDGVLGLMKVLSGVFVLGRVTAAEVATDEALS
jgi:hypothetical protein